MLCSASRWNKDVSKIPTSTFNNLLQTQSKIQGFSLTYFFHKSLWLTEIYQYTTAMVNAITKPSPLLETLQPKPN